MSTPDDLRTQWADFTAGREEYADTSYTDKELALAYELARIFQSPTPTIEQVSYFIDDAEAIAGDIPEQPWTIKAAYTVGMRFHVLALINDVLCGLEDGEGEIEFVALGRLPLEWVDAETNHLDRLTGADL